MQGQRGLIHGPRGADSGVEGSRFSSGGDVGRLEVGEHGDRPEVQAQMWAAGFTSGGGGFTGGGGGFTGGGVGEALAHAAAR
eukprot:1128753-Prorocentrum_minimum.AAC.1